MPIGIFSCLYNLPKFFELEVSEVDSFGPAEAGTELTSLGSTEVMTSLGSTEVMAY